MDLTTKQKQLQDAKDELKKLKTIKAKVNRINGVIDTLTSSYKSREKLLNE